MESKVKGVDVALGVVVGLIAFSGTLVPLARVSSTGFAFAIAGVVGSVLTVAVAVGPSRQRDRLMGASWEQQAAVVRELVRTTVPAAVDLATDSSGRLDPTRFQDLVVASIAAASDPRLGLPTSGPAVWDVENSVVRTPDQEQLLQRLLTYPDVAEAPALLATLEGMGPQTMVQFNAFAVRTRSRLAVGLEGVMTGPKGAALTGHLIAAGLVCEVDGPASAVLDPGPDGAYYALTRRGVDVARLFTPITARPQELAALDPTPVR